MKSLKLNKLNNLLLVIELGAQKSKIMPSEFYVHDLPT